MPYDGRLQGQLRKVILPKFSYNELKQLLRFDLNKNMEEITLASDLKEVVSTLLLAAEQNGWMSELLDALSNARPEDETFRAAIEQVRRKGQKIEDPSLPPNNRRLWLTVALSVCLIASVALLAALWWPQRSTLSVWIVADASRPPLRVTVDRQELAHAATRVDFLKMIEAAAKPEGWGDDVVVVRVSDKTAVGQDEKEPLIREAEGVMIIPAAVVNEFGGYRSAFAYIWRGILDREEERKRANGE